MSEESKPIGILIRGAVKDVRFTGGGVCGYERAIQIEEGAEGKGPQEIKFDDFQIQKTQPAPEPLSSPIPPREEPEATPWWKGVMADATAQYLAWLLIVSTGLVFAWLGIQLVA